MHLSPDELTRSWAGEPWLDDPRLGRVTVPRGFADWVGATRTWLEERGGRLRPVDRTETQERTVEEVVIDLSIEGERRELPVAIASDLTADGHLSAIRIYHSMWPLIGEHHVREPMLAGEPDLVGPDVVGRYLQALAGGDVEAVLAAYEDDATVIGPTGGSDDVHGGRQSLRRLYTQLFAGGGGIPLELCRLADDGRACTVEYNIVRWGGREMTPQAGLAVYQRGEAGRIASARRYDDATPPVAGDRSEPSDDS